MTCSYRLLCRFFYVYWIGETGKIDSTFGTTGKFRVFIPGIYVLDIRMYYVWHMNSIVARLHNTVSGKSLDWQVWLMESHLPVFLSTISFYNQL